VLDELERRAGFMVVYTHLFRRPAGMALENVNWSPLADLAARHRAGRIKVATASRLLAYAEMCESLEWTVRSERGEVEIRIDSHRAPADLQGLTFYVPNSRNAAISVGGERMDVERNPPDETGRQSISVPWRALRFPLTALTSAAETTGARV
jgi:hypothetical protein